MTPKSIQGLECCLKLLSSSSRKHVLNADLPLHGLSSLKKKMERRKKVREERREGGSEGGRKERKKGGVGKREKEKKTFIFY